MKISILPVGGPVPRRFSSAVFRIVAVGGLLASSALAEPPKAGSTSARFRSPAGTSRSVPGPVVVPKAGNDPGPSVPGTSIRGHRDPRTVVPGTNRPKVNLPGQNAPGSTTPGKTGASASSGPIVPSATPRLAKPPRKLGDPQR